MNWKKENRDELRGMGSRLIHLRNQSALLAEKTADAEREFARACESATNKNKTEVAQVYAFVQDHLAQTRKKLDIVQAEMRSLFKRYEEEIEEDW